MLELPQTGVRASRTTHNCDLHVFCDWIEGCLLFKGTLQLSRTDVLDILLEEDFYDDQTFANERSRESSTTATACTTAHDSRPIGAAPGWPRNSMPSSGRSSARCRAIVDDP